MSICSSLFRPESIGGVQAMWAPGRQEFLQQRLRQCQEIATLRTKRRELQSQRQGLPSSDHIKQFLAKVEKRLEDLQDYPWCLMLHLSSGAILSLFSRSPSKSQDLQDVSGHAS